MSDANVLETLVDKPDPSSPTVNYFYTSSRFFNYSLYPSLSVMSLMPQASYLLVNLEQSAPYDCSVASLQDAKTCMADGDQWIKR